MKSSSGGSPPPFAGIPSRLGGPDKYRIANSLEETKQDRKKKG